MRINSAMHVYSVSFNPNARGYVSVYVYYFTIDARAHVCVRARVCALTCMCACTDVCYARFGLFHVCAYACVQLLCVRVSNIGDFFFEDGELCKDNVLATVKALSERVLKGSKRD